jgi:DNA-binding response OmpR family regulator
VSTPPAPKRRVLFADDDPVVLKTLGTLLNKWGWEVIPVTDGKVALEVLQGENPPRLAILDWVMPGMDGLEVCRAVRGMQTSNPPYLIMLTGRGGREDLITGLEGGADEFLAKPVDPDELRARMHAAWRMVELQAGLTDRVQQLEDAPPVSEMVGEDHPGLRQTLRLCAATLTETLALAGVPRHLRIALRTCRGLCLEALGEGGGPPGQG